MDSPRDSPPAPATTVPRDIEEKLGAFNSQVLLMILSYVNGNFQETTPALIEHLLKLERDCSDKYSGIINYTFNRLKVDPVHFFTPDRVTVELPQEKAKGIELRLALVNVFLSLGDEQTAIRAVKKFAEGASLAVLERTPLEIIEEVCKRRSVEDVLVSIANSVAEESNCARKFLDRLGNPDWLHNRDDVNQFLREESGFGSSLLKSFMIHPLSTSDNALTLIKKNLRQVCQKYWKGVAFCIVLLLLSVILALVGVGISMWLSHHSSNSIDQSMKIGDIQSSSALILVPSNVSAVSLKSNNTHNPSEVKVFLTSSIPPNGTRILHSRMSHITRCTPYNFNNGDNPVYLLPGSIMNYTVTVSGSNHSQCTVQLVLFNKCAEYLACRYNTSSSIVKAYCLTNGNINYVSIRINESANYYVRLVTDDPTISVSSNIAIHQVYYNTSHLANAKNCGQISNDASCTVHNDDIKQWSCSNTEWYVILKSSYNAEVEYNYKTPPFDYCLLKEYLIITFVICIVVILIVLIGYCLWTRRRKISMKCKRNRGRRNGSIQYGTFTN